MRRALAAASTLLVLLTGCGGENPSPAPLPKPSPTASSSPSAEAQPPAMPSEAKENNKAGAISGVKWFLANLEFAGDAGDSTAFRKSFTSNCARCTAIADGIDKTHAAGGSIKGGAWRPKSFQFYGIRSGVAFVDAVVDYTPQTYQASATASPQAFPARSNVLKTFQLTRAQGVWKVAALDPRA